MAQGKKLRWAIASGRADVLVPLLADVCQRIEVAGSLRRREPMIGDIELVAIPQRRRDLLGQEIDSLLDDRLWALARSGILSIPTKNGDRYKQFALKPKAGEDQIKVDLFITSAECWGVILALRTGPAEFSKRLVMQAAHGGALLNGLVVADGRVWRNRRFHEDGQVAHAGEALETPEEADFFKLTARGWIDPWERSV